MKQLFFTLSFLVFVSLPLRAQVLQTIAGMNGDGGLAKDAAINETNGLAINEAGDIYISDRAVSVIRKISAKTGIITTIVGNGVAGYSGDGGQARLASLNQPGDIVLDRAGNLYIADVMNYRVRKVDVITGMITTIIGNGIYGNSGDNGLATMANIGIINQLAIDNEGNIFFGGSGVRKYNASNGIITKIYSEHVNGIAADNKGNLFLCSNSNYILKLSLSTGLAGIFYNSSTSGNINKLAIDSLGNLFMLFNLSGKLPQVGKLGNNAENFMVIAGDGNFDFSGDGGLARFAGIGNCTELALDVNANLFIGDVGFYRLRKISAGSEMINTIAGNGCYGGDGNAAESSFLSNPSNVEVDLWGNIFIADANNHRIRRIDALTGIITTVAGNGKGGFNGDSILATNAMLFLPTDIVVDQFGNIFIADAANHRIRKVDASSGVITTIAGNGLAGFSGDNLEAKNAKLNNPYNICLDTNGNIYISDRENHRIRKVAIASGIISTIAGNGIPGFSGDSGLANLAKIARPMGLDIDSNGNIFFADDEKRIRKIDAGSNIIYTIAGSGGLNFNGDTINALNANLNFTYLTLNKYGDILLNSHNRIRKVASNTGIITTVAGNGARGYSDEVEDIAAGLGGVRGIAIDTKGNIFFAESPFNRLRKISYQNEFIIWSSTLLPKREDTVTLYTSYQDSASYFEWNVSPNTFSYIMGTNANSGQPKIRFNKMGLYSIQLKLVYKGDTLTKTRLHYLNVLNPLLQNLDFTANKINPSYLDTLSLDLMFNDTAEHIQWTISPNTFNFVEGTNQTLRQPKLRFSQKGLYTVQVAVAYKGDTLIKTKTNYISVGSPPFPPLSFTSNNQLPKIGDTVTLVPQFSDSILFYRWTITPEQFSYLPGANSSSASPQISFTGIDQYYDVTLQIGYYLDTISISKKKFFYVSKPNGVEQLARHAYLVYPNPSSGIITIESNGQQYPILCEVWDATGKLQASHMLILHQTELTLPEPQGLYLLQIKDAEGRVAKMKVIKE